MENSFLTYHDPNSRAPLFAEDLLDREDVNIGMSSNTQEINNGSSMKWRTSSSSSESGGLTHLRFVAIDVCRWIFIQYLRNPFWHSLVPTSGFVSYWNPNRVN